MLKVEIKISRLVLFLFLKLNSCCTRAIEASDLMMLFARAVDIANRSMSRQSPATVPQIFRDVCRSSSAASPSSPVVPVPPCRCTQTVSASFVVMTRPQCNVPDDTSLINFIFPAHAYKLFSSKILRVFSHLNSSPNFLFVVKRIPANVCNMFRDVALEVPEIIFGNRPTPCLGLRKKHVTISLKIT